MSGTDGAEVTFIHSEDAIGCEPFGDGDHSSVAKPEIQVCVLPEQGCATAQVLRRETLHVKSSPLYIGKELQERAGAEAYTQEVVDLTESWRGDHDSIALALDGQTQRRMV